MTVVSAFESEGYGVLFPSESTWRGAINEVILKLKEDGKFSKLYSKWFDKCDK